MTSNVILFAYPQLTDAERLTLQVIDSFDWADRQGTRKGCAFPSLGRVAALRRLDVRTIRRHIANLQLAGLITRQERPGKPCILWIEEPSRSECERYLSTIGATPDVHGRGTPVTDVRPYKKTKSEEDKDVNEQRVLEGRNARGLTSNRSHPQLNEEQRSKRDYYASEILQVTKDEHSLGMYRRIAELVPPGLIFEALSIVKQLAHDGLIHTRRGALFVSLVRRSCLDHGIDLGISKSSRNADKSTQRADSQYPHNIVAHEHQTSSNSSITRPTRGP